MYQCRNCKWVGKESELDSDILDTCMGSDEVEMCPKCGSYEVNKIN